LVQVLLFFFVLLAATFANTPQVLSRAADPHPDGKQQEPPPTIVLERPG